MNRKLQEFMHHYMIHQQEIQVKKLAIQLFQEGNVNEGIFYAEKALKCHAEVFNCEECTVSKCRDLEKLEKISNLIPKALILLDNPENDEDKKFCAKYYKSQAESKLEKYRIYSALRLIEKALECDKSILDAEMRDCLPARVSIFCTNILGNLESNLIHQILSTCGEDYVSHGKVLFGLLNLRHSSSLINRIDQNLRPEIWSDTKMPLVIVLSALGYINTLKWVTDKNECLSLRDVNQSTTLMWASQFGQIDIVKYLLHSKEVNIDACNDRRWTALMYASANGHLEVVTVLLEHSAAVDVVSKMGLTALTEAIRNGHQGVVEKLIEYHADVNLIDLSWTPLALAARRGNLDIILMLLSNGALIDQITSSGYTPLMVASMEGQLDIVNVLLDQGAFVNCTSSSKKFSLMLATRSGHLSVVKTLLKRGANVDQQTNSGCTALTFASKEGRSEIVKALLKYGANVNIISHDHWSPLLLASDLGHSETVRILIFSGANIHLVCPNGYSALMLACASGQLDIVKMLILGGADIHLLTLGRSSALMSACQNRREDVVKFLLMKKAILNSEQYSRLNGEARLLMDRLQTQIQMVELADSEIDQLEANEGSENCLRKG